MQKIAQQKLTIVFWLLAAWDIISIFFGFSMAHYVAKSLLLPVLMLLWRTSDHLPGKQLLFAGLLFSWAGDVLLLFESRHSLFFIAGLASFLTTHIFYILFFLKKRGSARSLLLRQPYWLLLVPAYGFSLVWLLYPGLKDMKAPVIAYAAVICTMLLCSLHVFSRVNKAAGYLYILGALAFVTSDSLLALNKFYQPFPFANVLIMFTYCLAQFLIVRGFLAEETEG